MKITEILNDTLNLRTAAKRIATWIAQERSYHWVGIYEVTEKEISAIAWTGNEPPAYPRFPRTQGLCGAAVQARVPVIVGDVKQDPRYLTTFGSTQSEIIVPVMGAGGSVIGLIDVESERFHAFGPEDATFLEKCAITIVPLFEQAKSKTDQ